MHGVYRKRSTNASVFFDSIDSFGFIHYYRYIIGLTASPSRYTAKLKHGPVTAPV